MPSTMLAYWETTAKPHSAIMMITMFLMLKSTGTRCTKRERMMLAMAITSRMPLITSGNRPGPAREKSPIG